jgi:hypothetical protein
MVKIKPLFMFLFVFCILLIGCVSNAQQVSSEVIHSELATTAQSKQALVTAVLSEVGLPRRYNTYLGNSIDIAVSPETFKKDKFIAWMQALFVKEAGWSHVEAQYVDQLKANFSEAELKELLALAKRPLVKKLIQTELAAYSKTTEKRRRLLFELWNNYNTGEFTPPPDALP